jgi:peptidyl-prolyl cis-trans isomerase C
MNKTSSLVLAAASAAAVAVFSSCKPVPPAAENLASPTPAPTATSAAPSGTAPSDAAPATPGASPAASLDGLKDPVATVNGEPISKAELDEAFNEAVKAAGVPVNELSTDQKLMGYRQLLDRIILDKLLTKASEGVEISQADIDKQIAEIKAQFPSEEEFSKQLSEVGQTPEKFGENLKKMLQQEKWVTSQIAGKTDVTEDEARKFYDANKAEFEQGETVKASHILFAVKPGASAEEDKKQLEAAKKAIARAKKEDFAALAKELSDDPGSAQEGGDLGFFEKDRMVPEFAEAAFSQKVDTVSAEPVKTQFGYHVIKVTDRKPAQTESFEEVKDRLIAYLKRMKEGEAVNNLLQSLKNSAKIEDTLPTPQPPSLPMLPGMEESAPQSSDAVAPATGAEPAAQGN